LIYLLFRSNLLQTFSVTGLSPVEAADFARSFNHWMASFAVWVLVVGVIVLFFDVRRILRAVT
jgi:Na+/citrate or Na+/malate symporter